MAITPIGRQVSSLTTYVRTTRTAAITALLANDPSADSVIYGNLPGIWPELAQYDFPNNGNFNTVPNPSFIWAAPNFQQGERLGFAALIDNVPHNTALVVSLATFADNAHTAHIEIYKNGVLTQDISGELMDGSMDPATLETPPYNWQKIRLYSHNFVTNNVPAEPLQLVVSFEVQNYLNNGFPSSVNPAALAFQVDLYRG